MWQEHLCWHWKRQRRVELTAHSEYKSVQSQSGKTSHLGMSPPSFLQLDSSPFTRWCHHQVEPLHSIRQVTPFLIEPRFVPWSQQWLQLVESQEFSHKSLLIFIEKRNPAPESSTKMGLGEKNRGKGLKNNVIFFRCFFCYLLSVGKSKLPWSSPFWVIVWKLTWGRLYLILCEVFQGLAKEWSEFHC